MSADGASSGSSPARLVESVGDKAEFAGKPEACEQCKNEKPAAKMTAGGTTTWLCKTCALSKKGDIEKTRVKAASVQLSTAAGGLLRSASDKRVRAASLAPVSTPRETRDDGEAPSAHLIQLWYTPALAVTAHLRPETTPPMLCEALRKKLGQQKAAAIYMHFKDGGKTKLDDSDPVRTQYDAAVIRESTFRYTDPSGQWFTDMGALKGMLQPKTLTEAVRQLGLGAVMSSATWAPLYARACEATASSENPDFYIACHKYRQLPKSTDRVASARLIWKRHLAEGAPLEVNLRGNTYAALKEGIASGDVSLFDDAMREVLKLMGNNIPWASLEKAPPAGLLSPRAAAPDGAGLMFRSSPSRAKIEADDE